MILTVPSLFENKKISVEEFTLEDFRNISFLVEENMDNMLYEFLISKIKTPCNSVDKFNVLLEARKKFVSDTLNLYSEEGNISVNMNVFIESLKNQILEKQISKNNNIEDFQITVDYPDNFIHENVDELIIDHIKKISYKGNNIELYGESKSNKLKILEKLPSKLITYVSSYISENLENDIILMNATKRLDKISINFINGSAFDFIKSIFYYYKYEEILELIFSISRRIPDIGYINSRNPRDLNTLIRLYSDEVEKSS